MFRANQRRNQIGQAVALPMIMVAVLIILAAGLFSFELGRTAIAKDQLQAATEAAALAGAATLAGSTDEDINASQQNAIAAAKKVFQQNTIFADSLNQAQEGDGKPASKQAFISFQFLDPSNNNAPVPQGDPRGKTLEVRTVYGLPALAGKVIGLGDGPTIVSAKSAGGVGQLDVILCFDCSTSMRLKTFTTAVRRTFNSTTGKIDYVIGSQTAEGLSGGMNPQLLDGLNASLRLAENSPPGNTPPGFAQNSGFTDRVVNLDEHLSFQGFSEGNFTFPNIAALVEASRGNLENDAVFQASGAAMALQGVVTPQAGYQAKYFELSRKHTHPWIEAETAAGNFFTLMNNNTRARFGLVAFNQQVGSSANFTYVAPKIASNYTAGGQGQFPLPAISLSSSPAETNFSQVSSVLGQLVPFGNTNIGASLQTAQGFFNANTTRPNAKKAIILFTDGIPSVGNPSPEQACNIAAQSCRLKGIPVFTVGLNLEPSERQEQAAVLNQITGIAGNGGRSFQVTDASKLNAAFSSIARSLTQIVQ